MYAQYLFVDPVQPRRYTPDLDGLIAFLKTQDPKAPYDFWDHKDCALAQFSTAVTGSLEFHRTLTDAPYLDLLACMRPWTMGALLWRAQAVELLAKLYPIEDIIDGLVRASRAKHAHTL